MDRFDLEQKIMDCWGIIEDLDDLLRMVHDSDIFGVEPEMSSEKMDQLTNTIIGLKTLYHKKFETMFGIFEEVIWLEHVRRKSNESDSSRI